MGTLAHMPDNRAELPLTDAQLGVWLAERGGFGGPGAYQWAEYLELDGPDRKSVV